MGCVYIFTRRYIWSFKRCLERMYDLNVTMQQYLLFVQRWIIGNRMWIWLSTTPQGGYWTC